jgi:hypothetical protein
MGTWIRNTKEVKGGGMEAMRMVANLIGPEEFADLLMDLPDEFFALSMDQKEKVWKELLSECNRGAKPEQLAELAKMAVGVLQVI